MFLMFFTTSTTQFYSTLELAPHLDRAWFNTTLLWNTIIKPNASPIALYGALLQITLCL